jgi:hypothetical protein
VLGALGLLPALAGIGDPLASLAWIAVVSPAVGVVAAGLGLGAWPFGLAVPAAWMIGLVWLDARAGAALPDPAWAAMTWTGMYALGFAAGALSVRRAPRTAALAFALAGLLAGLPLAGGAGAGMLGDRTWGEITPDGAARLFDASPVTMLLESAGVDWMRHPSVYDAAGTEWFSDRRAPYRGRLAGPLLLVVGCASVLAVARRIPIARRTPRARE